MAVGLYTVIPGFSRWDDAYCGGLSAVLPAVGLLLGLAWWGIAALAGRWLPLALAAIAIALAMPVLTGFLHLDGLMDVADAALSSRSREEKLRILKDPHTGAFGVIVLVCVLLTQVAASGELVRLGAAPGALLLLPVVSRAMAGLALMRLAPLAQSGYGRMHHETATPGKQLLCGLAVLAALAAGFLWIPAAGWACCAAVAAFVLVCAGAVRSLGGMNGDVAGFGICLSELVGVVALACLV